MTKTTNAPKVSQETQVPNTGAGLILRATADIIDSYMLSRQASQTGSGKKKRIVRRKRNTRRKRKTRKSIIGGKRTSICKKYKSKSRRRFKKLSNRRRSK
tara:strand:- start:2207 stop:2506 length:300 start_codon:yes stop_codon:yes gene_type:complete